MKADDTHFNLKKGDIYEASTYWLDPDKFMLICKLTKKSRKPIGKRFICNVYKSQVKVVER